MSVGIYMKFALNLQYKILDKMLHDMKIVLFFVVSTFMRSAVKDVMKIEDTHPCKHITLCENLNDVSIL